MAYGLFLRDALRAAWREDTPEPPHKKQRRIPTFDDWCATNHAKVRAVKAAHAKAKADAKAEAKCPAVIREALGKVKK